ncbi:hypothetical protein AMTRI_Chr01g129050 [Amborella trichopoda]
MKSTSFSSISKLPALQLHVTHHKAQNFLSQNLNTSPSDYYKLANQFFIFEKSLLFKEGKTSGLRGSELLTILSDGLGLCTEGNTLLVSKRERGWWGMLFESSMVQLSLCNGGWWATLGYFYVERHIFWCGECGRQGVPYRCLLICCYARLLHSRYQFLQIANL